MKRNDRVLFIETQVCMHVLKMFLNGKASFHVVVMFFLMHMFATRCSRRTDWSTSISVLKENFSQNITAS